MTLLYLLVGCVLIVVILAVLMKIMTDAYAVGVVTPGFKPSCTLWLACFLMGTTIVGTVIWVSRLLYGG